MTQQNAYKSGVTAGTQLVTADDPTGQYNDDIYLKLTVSLADNELDMTTVDGYSYGVTDEHQVVGYAPEASFGTISLTAQSAYDETNVSSGDAVSGTKYAWAWYSDSACSTPASSIAVANIVGSSVKVTAAAGERTRITTTNPAATVEDAANIYNNAFYTAFNGTLADDDLEVGTLTVADGGAVSGTISLYYSVAGETPDVTKATVDARSLGDMSYESTVTASALTISFALTPRA